MRTGTALSLVAGATLIAMQIAQAQDTKAFRLQIGEQTFDIDVGEEAEIALPDGSRARVMLSRNEFAAYSGEGFSFVHPSEVSVTRSDLGDGIVQHLMTTALGSMVIVQTYDGLDPSSLNELMLKELTKDAVAAGAQLERKPASRKTIGKELTGIVATETLKRDTVDYEVQSYGSNDAGIMVITRMARENAEQDGGKIAKFWETLKVQ